MKHQYPPSFRYRRLVAAVGLAVATMAGTPAHADPLLTIKLFRDSEVMFRDADMSRWAENYFEIGAGTNSADSLRFGQFSGLTDKGGFPLAGFNWLSRSQGNDAQYWQAHGANLGLDSKKLKIEGGIQGSWEAWASFDGLKKSQTESAQFFHQGLGTSELTLPAGFTLVTDPRSIPNSRYSPFEIQQGRDIARLGIKGLLGPEWEYKVNYREDRRDGTRITGISFANGGGDAYLVPYQINDKTQQIEAVLTYAGKVAQFQLGYTFSQFSNALTAFNVTDPNNASGRMSLAPDNDHHQVNANGAYNFTKSTRLTANFSYGIARQNESFLPYSANGAAAAAALPRGSLEGKVVNSLFDVALTAKPLDKLDIKVAYQHRSSDNRTPRMNVIYASRDSANQGAATGVSNRTTAPMSTQENKLSLEGNYAVAEKTVLRLGLEHANKNYTLADRHDTQTTKLTTELRKPLGDDFLGSAGYIYTQRKGSDYNKNLYFTNTYTGTSAGNLTNNPSMRQFMWADYDEDRVRATGNWTLSETLSVQGVVDTYSQKYRGPSCGQFSDGRQPLGITGTGGVLPDTCLGRSRADGNTLSLDLQYQPEENLTTFAFASMAQTGYKQIGRSWSAGSNQGALETRNWYGDIKNRDNAIGLGLKWQPEERWDLGGTYVVNQSVGKSVVEVGSALTPSSPMPDTWSRLHSLQLFAKWDQTKQLSWRFNYLYESLKSYDWAINSVPTNFNANVGFTGQQDPRYSNHVFGVSAVIKNF